MALLTRDQSFSSAPLLKVRVVPVPEFGEGCEIALRALTARQRWSFGQMASKSADDPSKGPEPTSYLITLAAVDADGKTLYQAQDSDAIAEWPGALVERLGAIVMQDSGLTGQAADDAKNDSAPIPSGASPSDSVVSSDVPPTS